jgi:hypothetical protein
MRSTTDDLWLRAAVERLVREGLAQHEIEAELRRLGAPPGSGATSATQPPRRRLRRLLTG